MLIYLQLDCAACGEEVHLGPLLTLLTHDGHPVVAVASFEQERYTCSTCGAANYTADLDVYAEGVYAEGGAARRDEVTDEDDDESTYCERGHLAPEPCD